MPAHSQPPRPPQRAEHPGRAAPLGIFQITTAPTGTAWYYEGGTLGYRVVHFYFPRSGIIIAVATNSSTDLGTSGDLQATAIAVYQTLEKAGAVHPS